MYAIPNGSNGQPNYNLYPPVSQAFEIGSNCNSNSLAYIPATSGSGNNGNSKAVGNSNPGSPGSRCNGQFGAVVPSPQTFPTVTATQQLAFMLVNMTLGVGTTATQGGSNNMYGAAPGNFELVSTAPLSLGQGPAQNTDNTPAIIQQLTGTLITQPATHYTQTLNPSRPNCAVIIQIVDPNNLPTSPPSGGGCFAVTDPASGSQYANFSCAQMAGRTFMYWFNDMGGSIDDYDYNDFYFTVRCVPGTASPNGGTVQNTTVPTGNITVGARAMSRAQPKRTFSSLGRDRRGLAAVEFALVSIPFCTLLFFILMAGIQLFTYGAMDAAAHRAARQIRIGAARGTSDSVVRNMICTQMANLASPCSALQIYVTSGPSFGSLQAAAVSGTTLSKTGFNPGVNGNYVLLQVAYTSPAFVSLAGQMASTFLTTVTFRNEP